MRESKNAAISGRVCLIEPDALRRVVYQRHLRSLGHTVILDSLPFVAKVGDVDEVPFAVIADLSGDRRRPTETLAALRRRFPSTPSILLLGTEQSIAASDALASGVCAMLHDPIRLEELELHLARCMRGRRTRVRRPDANAQCAIAANTEGT